MATSKTTIDALYRELGPMIYARCCRTLKDRAAAEDATQEIFVRIMRAGNMPEGSSRIAWIHRVTMNHCLNVLRDGSRRPGVLADEEIPEVASEQDTEQQVIQDDFASQLFARMPEAVRAPAVLFHQRGMQQQAIAEALGVSRRTVLYRLAEFAERASRFAMAT